MSKEKINLEELVALTKELFHAYYSGNLEPWFSYLCPDSVYLGTGEPILFGGDAIRNHFMHYSAKQSDIMKEEYFPIALVDQAAQVCGHIIIKSQNGQFYAITHFTMGYRLFDGEIKLVHQHNSYEYMRQEESDVVKLDVNTMQFVRNLLLQQPSGKRIPIRSGRQTIFIDLHTVLYVQSQRKRTEFVCIDRVISCNSPIGDLAKILPEIFYPLHRGYLVNTQYIVAIRRFEAELISGISIPIPSLTYTQVKQDLQEIISRRTHIS
ncbi:MAG: LytTR family transcriptional regulator [Lachnospiraceae bacterium]|nr:LytTR family transcriptional regulator [Lachnospiraceae bacterium]